jgi:hypothetical protein
MLISTVLWIVIFRVIFAALPIPERCDQMHFSTVFSGATSNISLLSFDFDLSVYQDNNVTHVSVQRYNVSAFNASYFTQPLGAYIDLNPIECIRSKNNETAEFCYFETKNSTIQLFSQIHLMDYTDRTMFFWGVVDEISFSLAAGPIFDRKYNCEFDSDSHAINDKYNITFKQCCTSFKATYNPDGYPVCTNFQSRSTIYNTDDNYSIFATAKFDYVIDYSADYVVADGAIIANGTLTGPPDLNTDLFSNGYWICPGYSNSQISSCQFLVPNGDSKFLFLLDLYPLNGTLDYGFYYVGLAGRLIIRNNQTLSEEGMNFTPTNDCSYFSNQVDKTKVFTSKFCCTKFASASLNIV